MKEFIRNAIVMILFMIILRYFNHYDGLSFVSGILCGGLCYALSD